MSWRILIVVSDTLAKDRTVVLRLIMLYHLARKEAMNNEDHLIDDRTWMESNPIGWY